MILMNCLDGTAPISLIWDFCLINRDGRGGEGRGEGLSGLLIQMEAGGEAAPAFWFSSHAYFFTPPGLPRTLFCSPKGTETKEGGSG